MDSENTIEIGAGAVTVRYHGRTAPVTAKILGTEIRCGREYIYLDRLVHRAGDTWRGFSVSGAISTIISRSAV